LDGHRLPNNAISNPNLRHSFHELISPADLSSTGTPDSSTTNTSIPKPYPINQQFGINNALPDLTAMMFPSADPFAYPNQPMMTFENVVKQEDAPVMNGSQAPQMYLSNGTPGGGRMYDDLEGQLFGPLPPYLQQGQPYDMQSHVGGNVMTGISPDMHYHTGITPNDEMAGAFDGIFSGDGDEWGNMLHDSRFRQ